MPDPPTRPAVRTIVVPILLVVAVLIGVTGVTGLTAPGPLQRYPYRDLSELAADINATAGEFRTPDDCWRLTRAGGSAGPTAPLRQIAKVDYVRSRVVVRLYTRRPGRIDRATRSLADREIDAVLAADPAMERKMINIEPSPDGWSPKLECRVPTAGRN